MSKFLLNLLLQISKALVNSKIQFLVRKFFFLISARPTLRGPRPLASQPTGRAASQAKTVPRRPIQPARRSRLCKKYVFPFDSCLPSRPPLPHLSDTRAPAVSSIPHLQPPELTRTATAPRSPSAAQLHTSGSTGPLPPRPHFPSLKSPLKPSPSSMALKPLTPVLNSPATPPRRSLGPL
jgi:hypothetical protein